MGARARRGLAGGPGPGGPGAGCPEAAIVEPRATLAAAFVLAAAGCATPESTGPADAPTRTGLFGCWAHTTAARHNELMLCSDGAFVHATVVYPNARIGSPPTLCSSREGIELTTEIPCALGETFGAFFTVTYQRRQEPLGSLTLRWEHPPLDNPEIGIQGSSTEYPAPIPPDLPLGAAFTTYGGWALDTPHDLVSGDWRVSLLHEGRELAHQDFQTVGCPPSNG